MKDYKAISKTMFILNNFEDYSVDDVVGILQAADDLYYNDDHSFLTDDEYDTLRLYGQKAFGSHPYFAGVGADVRGGKVPLPTKMGSLDQVEVGEISDWIKKWTLENHHLCLTDKLDGVSALLVYDDSGNFTQAFSRGNGVEGADTTRHIKKLKCIPRNIGRKTMIRGEIIVSKQNFPDVQRTVKSKAGTPYRNARNAIAGLMNAEKNNPDVYQYIDFVAYDEIGAEAAAKIATLNALKHDGFLVPYFDTIEGLDATDEQLTCYLEKRRAKSSYEIDGIVIDVDSATKRNQMNPTKDTLNPAYSVKYKVADASNIAVSTVVGVHWNVSKHGYLKPRVEITPVELVGVTVTYATGFNAKFIKDNNIAPGAVVQITRSGDVIPFLQQVIQPADTWAKPDGEWEWNATGVDAVMVGHEDNTDVIINQLVDFFASVGVPMLRKGNVEKLFHAGFTNSADIISASEDQFVSVIGENGKKIYAGIKKAFSNIPLWKLMGSTTFFGRGVGVRKMKKLVQTLGSENIITATVEDIVAVEGFDEKTANKIVDGLPAFSRWAFQLEQENHISIDCANNGPSSRDNKLTGQHVVFTGFRDKEMQEMLESLGGTMQSSVNKKTTILVSSNPTSNTGKMKKAKDLGIAVMGVEEFKRLLM